MLSRFVQIFRAEYMYLEGSWDLVTIARSRLITLLVSGATYVRPARETTSRVTTQLYKHHESSSRVQQIGYRYTPENQHGTLKSALCEEDSNL